MTTTTTTKTKTASANTRRYRLTLTEPMLGSKPLNPEIYTDFVAAKKLDATPKDEIDAARRAEAEIEGLEKGMTIFHRNTGGQPIIYDYQVRGFFKSACAALRRDPSSASAGCKAYKSVIDGNVFVLDREIVCQMPDGGKVEILERPLRAQTMQGERVALAKSEMIPAGTVLEFSVRVLGTSAFWTLVTEWLDYGALRGLGQWRNASYGRFTWEEVK